MKKTGRLIVFLIPPEKIVNGGILSIFSICDVTRKFRSIHKSEVIIATYPGTHGYRKNDLFENSETIYSFDEVVKRDTPDFLQLHVPEYASLSVLEALKNYSNYLSAIPDLRVNIMNQNILMMPKPLDVASWFSLTPNVTQTTAHDKYSNQELADLYGIPTHHLSTFVNEHNYTYVPYEKKSNVIALSLDVTEKKEQIVARLQKELPAYDIVTIQNMSYEEYKEFISKAKFTITFGEGFDGYYVEGFFTGGITFAVYNNDFFPDQDFATFKNVYDSYDAMERKIVGDMKTLDNNPAQYKKVVEQNLNKINSLYSYSRYVKNIEKFYKGDFTFLPQAAGSRHLLGEIVIDRDSKLAEKDAAIQDVRRLIEEKDKEIREKEVAIQKREKVLQELLNSHSWKVTKPLRKALSLVKKKNG